MNIELSRRSKVRELLVAQGMPGDVFRTPAFSLEEHLTTIYSEVDGVKPRRIKKDKQLASVEAVLARPLRDPYLMVIGCSPNDMRGRLLAAFLMQEACRHLVQVKEGRHKFPLWHFVHGAFADSLRDGKTSATMLILSTVTKDSSNVKVEKVHDLLNKYSHLPRIVVVAGVDPLTWANTRLFMPVNHCVYLTSRRQVEL